MKLTKNFRKEEFVCKCGCGRNEMDMNFIHKLQHARDIAGIPFVITSGFRCPKHNEAVHGTPDSSHMLGLAADIACGNDEDRYCIINALRKAAFSRIGIGEDFIHVDDDTDKKMKVVWLY